MIAVKTFPNMFVPMIKPTLRNANCGPNIFVKLRETKTKKIKIIDVKSILFSIILDLHKKS